MTNCIGVGNFEIWQLSTFITILSNVGFLINKNLGIGYQLPVTSYQLSVIRVLRSENMLRSENS